MERGNFMKKLTSILLSCLFVFFLTGCGSQSASTQTNNDTKKVSKDAYVPTEEEKKVLAKHYDQLNGTELDILEKLQKKSDLFTDSINANIKDDLDRLKKEKDEQIKKSIKQSDENKQQYDDFKKEIEGEFPAIKYDMITGTDKSKSLMLYISLLDNLDMTKAKCKELALNKETKMKDIGIKTIIFSIKNKNNEPQGSFMFELKNGRYELTLDAS
jgi:hypothetical protein